MPCLVSELEDLSGKNKDQPVGQLALACHNDDSENDAQNDAQNDEKERRRGKLIDGSSWLL